jgi:quinol monooxygenase YgiN
MLAAMPEAHPPPRQRQTCPDWATPPVTDLRQIPGFADDDYHQSVSREGWVLSLSTWEDEKALAARRTHPTHQQAKGRDEVFIDHTRRAGRLTRDTDLPEGCALSEQRLDETGADAGNTAVLVDTTQATPVPTTHEAVEMASHLDLDLDAAGLTDWDIHEAAPTPDHFLTRTAGHDQAAEAFETTAAFPDGTRLRRIRITRFHSTYDRRAAPQHHPDYPT